MFPQAIRHNRRLSARFSFRMKSTSLWDQARAHRLVAMILTALLPSLFAAEPMLQKSDVFPLGLNSIARYRFMIRDAALLTS